MGRADCVLMKAPQVILKPLRFKSHRRVQYKGPDVDGGPTMCQAHNTSINFMITLGINSLILRMKPRGSGASLSCPTSRFSTLLGRWKA